MSRKELIEWIVILVIIVAWWPRIFLNYDPLWYHILIYYVSPVVLFLIFLNRHRKMQAGFDYSEAMIEGQGGGPEPEGQPEAEGEEEATASDTEPRAEQARASLPWMQEPGDSADDN